MPKVIEKTLEALEILGRDDHSVKQAVKQGLLPRCLLLETTNGEIVSFSTVAKVRKTLLNVAHNEMHREEIAQRLKNLRNGTDYPESGYVENIYEWLLKETV